MGKRNDSPGSDPGRADWGICAPTFLRRKVGRPHLFLEWRATPSWFPEMHLSCAAAGPTLGRRASGAAEAIVLGFRRPRAPGCTPDSGAFCGEEMGHGQRFYNNE